MRRLLLLLALLLALAACEGATNPNCPNPAVFDNQNCTFDSPTTQFGP